MPPLTRLLIDLDKADTTRLAKADPARMAAHYGLRVDVVREYLRLAREARG